MIVIDKSHDPRKNADLLVRITEKQLDIKKAIRETEQIFQECLGKEISPQINNKGSAKLPFSQKILGVLFRFTAKPSRVLERTKTYVDAEGNIYPEWMPRLDEEYHHLEKNLIREVNVLDYGAIGDGINDCTAAFKKAIGHGQVKVFVPEGVFITKGIRLPSYTYLVGTGKGSTVIKLHDRARKGTRLITNAHHWRGNHHLFVQGMSLDWNVERLGEVKKTATWGNHSSCLTFANVTYGWVKDVEGINPGLHCFDISSTLYNYGGDGYRARGGSKYVWLDHLNGHGFGDDGITTHHSDFIMISNSHMCDPSGRSHRKGSSNSNGFEIDDGSRNVLLVNNSSARCFGGIEIKAHQNSSAASNVEIIGHISVNDNRSYNFRHIGHHKSTDNESKSAYHIVATNLVSIAPIFTDLYHGSTPRGMVVSAYKNVVINHFTLIGDPEYDYEDNPVIAIQYRARNINLHNLSISGFRKAGVDVKTFGGVNRPELVHICNIKIINSAPIAVMGFKDSNIQHLKRY
jgi:hypothetical protein